MTTSVEKPAFYSNGFVALSSLRGNGFLPFVVATVDVEYRVGQTAIVVEIDIERPWGTARFPFEFAVEDTDVERRYQDLERWRDFLRALGLTKSPDHSDVIVGRRGVVRVDGFGFDAKPEFARLPTFMRFAA